LRTITRRLEFVRGLCFCIILLAGATRPAAAALGCADLANDPAAGLAGNAKISALTTTLIAAGTPADSMGPPPGVRLPQGAVPAAPPERRHLAYCQVEFTYSGRGGVATGYAPGEAQHIRIRLGLPLSSADGGQGGKSDGAWNGKIENLGGAGCAGRVMSTVAATDDGYVGSSTDTGHTEQENGSGGPGTQRCNFGVVQTEHRLDTGLIDDFIYEGVHQQVEWAKAVAQAYYSTAVQRNYWNGCSTGGRQGLALAEKYGDEFDGFIIGAPAIYWQAFRLADAWPALVVKDTLKPKGKTLSSAQFAAASKAAVVACDVNGTDKVRDGLIDDPRACTFSARANLCGTRGAPAAPDCLDADQARAIDLIWDGPRNSKGVAIWYPFDRGIALSEGGFMGGFGAIPGSTAQVISYDHADLGFPVDNLYLNQAAITAAGNPHGAVSYEAEAVLGSREVGDLMTTSSVDLRKVRDHGGKIIMWQGTADAAIRWRHSADYYRRVATFFGNGTVDFSALQSWFRYYHAPGVGHCGGGEGPAPVAIFDQLVNWVEQNKAPDSILAKGGSANPARTRPLCAWPQTAIYNGTGNTDDTSNFHCGGNLDDNHSAVCKMVHTQYKHEDQALRDDADKGLSKLHCK
jgi:feruloyl esterase